MKKARKFRPKKGQVDFTNVRWCPVINCVVRYKGKILLVQRSKQLKLYPGYWNGVSGFLDDRKSLEEKVQDELREELGVKPHEIMSIKTGRVLMQNAPKYKKTWLVVPVLVDISTDKIELDWEAKNYAWFAPRDVLKQNTLPGFSEVFKILLPVK